MQARASRTSPGSSRADAPAATQPPFQQAYLQHQQEAAHNPGAAVLLPAQPVYDDNGNSTASEEESIFALHFSSEEENDARPERAESPGKTSSPHQRRSGDGSSSGGGYTDEELDASGPRQRQRKKQRERKGSIDSSAEEGSGMGSFLSRRARQHGREDGGAGAGPPRVFIGNAQSAPGVMQRGGYEHGGDGNMAALRVDPSILGPHFAPPHQLPESTSVPKLLVFSSPTNILIS